MLRPGAGSWVASFGNEGREYAPLRRLTTRWVRSCQAELRGRVLLTGARGAWGGIETPEPLVVARFPMVNVPVCVFTSVAKCVLQRTHSGSARACAKETPCVDETPGMSETPCVEATQCVSGVVMSVPECVLPSAPCVEEIPCVSGVFASVPGCLLPSTPCVSETPWVSAPACEWYGVCGKRHE